MSYSQYRQRNESGKSAPSGMAFPSSFKKEHTITSEDEEQVTQEGSFTGYSHNRSNPSTWQAFSSIKRTSRMGRLKTAPVNATLYNINFSPGPANLNGCPPPIVYPCQNLLVLNLLQAYTPITLNFTTFLATYTSCNY